MQTLQKDWLNSTNPYRHYVCMKGGLKSDTGEMPAEGTVAIVIPVRNELKFFKLCFHSLLSFTDRPFMISIIDHLGDLSTKKYFWSMHKNHQVYIHNYTDTFNYSAEINLGVREAFKFPQVKYAIALNADTVVEPFWLSKMLTVMNVDPRIGIVGPLSNRAIHEQTDREKINKMAGAARVSGFCMLFRREVWETLDGFDEQFVGGGFEDWDFCERARRRGWHVAIDGWTHVHHFYRQFRHHEFDDEMRANEERFFKKHPLVRALIQGGSLVRVNA